MTNAVSRTISDEQLSKIIQIESAGRPNAKAGTSSATGLGQFVNATWMQVVRQHRPDLLNGRTEAQVLAMRTDPSLAVELLARFTEDNARVLGAGYSDGDLYLAHFAGAGTARKLLRADPGAPTTSVFTPSAIAANRTILAGKTCGEVRAWAERRMVQSGGRNWIGVYIRGEKPAAPRAVKAIAAGSSASATVVLTAGVQQGWHLSQWLIAAGLLFVVAGIIGTVWWFWRQQRPNKIETQGAGHGME